jgi:histidine ammonia-lyase
MAENLAAIVAIEAMMAAQGIEMRLPLKPGPRVAAAVAMVRAHTAFIDADRVLSGEMASLSALVAGGAFLAGHPDIGALLPSGGPR